MLQKSESKIVGRWGLWLAPLLLAELFCLQAAAKAETQTPARAETQTAAIHKSQHHLRKAAKKPLPPLPSGPRGPVPQIPLDALPAVAPTVAFQNGLLTITAANSTLGDVLREVRKQTSADIDVPANANERVAVRLGPAPPREVVADLLNGSHFNYILLGSPENTSSLVRVVLVAKTGPDNPAPTVQANATPAPVTAKPADDADAADNSVDEAADQAATQADETPPDEPGVKTPQQMLQEMQQRQLQLQQQQQQQNNGQALPGYPSPGVAQPPAQPQQE
ncbi:MAG: hypothetical protein WCF22_20935 [Candidatus Sulfotelmatobacter sp.]